MHQIVTSSSPSLKETEPEWKISDNKVICCNQTWTSNENITNIFSLLCQPTIKTSRASDMECVICFVKNQTYYTKQLNLYKIIGLFVVFPMAKRFSDLFYVNQTNEGLLDYTKIFMIGSRSMNWYSQEKTQIANQQLYLWLFMVMVYLRSLLRAQACQGNSLDK